MSTRLPIVFAALVLALRFHGATASDGMIFKYSPRVGDIHKYRQIAKLDFEGKGIDYSALATRKVSNVDSAGNFTIVEELSELKINGMDGPQGALGGPTATTYSSIGVLVNLHGDGVDASLYRAANLEVFVFPDHAVRMGDSWTHDFQANATTGAVAATASYTYVADEKLDAIETSKLTYKIREVGSSGASTEGTAWISKADGSLVKLITKWVNVPAQVGSISGSVSIVRLP